MPAKAIDALRAEGHDVLAIREASPGISDEAVLRHATAEQRVLITFDRDFGELIFRQGLAAPPAIVYLRVIPRSPEDAIRMLISAVADPNALTGAITVHTEQGVRRRRFPKRIE